MVLRSSTNNPWVDNKTPTPDRVNAGYLNLVGDEVNAKYIKPGTGVPSGDLAAAVQTSLGKADVAYVKPGTGIPSGDLAAAVTAALALAGTAYQKPAPGIPSADLAAAVTAALALASSASQPGHTHLAASITDFAEAVDDRVNALLVQGTGITLSYNDAAGTLTVTSTGGGGGSGNIDGGDPTSTGSGTAIDGGGV
jgi:hypothetical protein